MVNGHADYPDGEGVVDNGTVLAGNTSVSNGAPCFSVKNDISGNQVMTYEYNNTACPSNGIAAFYSAPGATLVLSGNVTNCAPLHQPWLAPPGFLTVLPSQ